MVTIEQEYVRLHPKSARLYDRGKELFPDGVTHDTRRLNPFPLYVTHATGSRKWDVDGHEYVDYRMGHGSLLLGHSHPEIIKVVNSQMEKGTHYGACHELELEWAKWITQLIPSAEKIRFHNSGTEATLMAMRMARAYTGKTKIVKFNHHFHGWNDYMVPGSGGVSGGIPAETLDTVIVIPDTDVGIVEQTLENDDGIAAVIVEATGGHMGAYPIDAAFLHQIREVTKKHEVIFILDEVVTGFRVSTGGAQYRYGVTPDLTTMAKILAGGLPGGAVAGRADIINMIEEGHISHPGTFNANPLSAAAGAKALELISTQPINETADAMAQRLKDGVNQLLTTMEIPGCCSGVASMIHLRIGKAHECDKEICNLTREELDEISSHPIVNPLRLALFNAGVDANNCSLVSAVHKPQDIDHTIAAYERAFIKLREEDVL